MDVQSKRSIASPPQIPEEIIEEIISRVPVKTVLRCRCLSKPLCSLIGTKHFIAKHLRNSPAASRFILNSGVRGRDAAHLESPLFQQIIESLLRNRVADRVPDGVRVLGCVDGLACYLDDRLKVFNFWNPSTRVTTALPKVGCNSLLTPGFGFDESTGEFKVFAVFGVEGQGQGQGCRYKAKVYSSKSNSWKLLNNSGVISHTTESGIFVCGKLHWPRRRGGKHYVYSFDVKTEAFGEIELPQFALQESSLQMNMGVGIRIRVNLSGVSPFPEVILGVLGGRLSSILGFSKNSERKVEVWVMEEYGVKESWTKVANLQPPYSLAAPFCTGPNGEILFVYGSYFLAYYPNDNVFRCFGHNASYGGVHHCVESLVTPDYAAQ